MTKQRILYRYDWKAGRWKVLCTISEDALREMRLKRQRFWFANGAAIKYIDAAPGEIIEVRQDWLQATRDPDSWQSRALKQGYIQDCDQMY